MASLWKQNRSPFWTACFTGADGRRLKKSTKQSDRRKALAVTLEWERLAEAGRRCSLTEAQARKVVSEIVERTTGEPLVFYSAADWLRTWADAKEQAKAKGTGVRYQQVVRDFLQHLGPRSNVNLAQITPRDIQTFRDSHSATGKSASTCNFLVRVIRSALSAARRQGFIGHNPAEAIGPLAETAEEKSAFTHEEVCALLAKAEGEWRGAILAGYYTGARLSDIANLQWQSVDLSAKVVRFVARKTKRSVTVPLHPELATYLASHEPLGATGVFVFPTLAMQRTGGAYGLSAAFMRIMHAAGFSAPLKETRGKGRRVSPRSYHSLRHSFNSAMANAGVAQEVRQKLTGHADAETNKIYTHHELAVLREAVAKVPGLNRTKS